jgi:uncharacterized protein (DUF433 family)
MKRAKIIRQAKERYRVKAQHDWRACCAVEQIPGKVSGTIVFRGTRVPVRALFENLRDGASIEDFLNWFPGVTRDQVKVVLGYELESLTLPIAQ